MSLDHARALVLDRLQPRGFVRRGEVLLRSSSAITQVVAVVPSRFVAGVGPNYAWIEVVLLLGPGPAGGRTLAAYQQAPDVIASLRLDEIVPGTPPYFDTDATDATDATDDTDAGEFAEHLTDGLLPFLEATTTVAGVQQTLEQLGDTRILARAILYAKIGQPAQSRALFARAPGDAEAIRRLAASLGIELQ